MKKVLVAFDGSPGAEAAMKDLSHAGLPKRLEARVLTIADVWLPPAPAGEVEALFKHTGRAASYQKAGELLREAKKTSIGGAQHLHGMFPEWNITNVAQAESPPWGIIAEACAWNADLIVIGSHGRTPFGTIFLGSVSYTVAAEAQCSVRVVRPRSSFAALPMRLLVGLDRSEDASGAVDEIARRAWRAGTEVELVTVIDAKLRSQSLARSGPFGDPQLVEKFEDGVQLSLENARQKLTASNLIVQCHTFEGDPKRILLQLAADWKVDGIFLGARGMGRADRDYFGSLASAVCMRAHCTVEIFRTNRPAPLPPGVDAGMNR